MAYLGQEDVYNIIRGEDLDVLTQAVNANFEKAEKATVDFFKGYIRTRYDADALFTDWDGQGQDPRPAALVTMMCDYLLGILYSTVPDRMIPEYRVERIDAAKEWLKDIAKGNIDPDFPTVDTADETDTLNPVQWGSATRTSSNW